MTSNGMAEPLIVLSRRDVLDLLTLRDCIGAVEGAFRLHAEGRTLGPGVLGVPAAGGGFHMKAAGLVGERSYFAAKTNARRLLRPGAARRLSSMAEERRGTSAALRKGRAHL